MPRLTLYERLATFPTFDDARDRCPNRAEHTPSPDGYLAYASWADEKIKTHKQKRCEGCGRYFIWVPK